MEAGLQIPEAPQRCSRKKIKKKRRTKTWKSRGLTQEQLAEKMHVTSTYIVKIENGQRTGSIEFSVDLANCFGVSLDYLLLGTEVENKKQILQRVISFLSELEAEL